MIHPPVVYLEIQRVTLLGEHQVKSNPQFRRHWLINQQFQILSSMTNTYLKFRIQDSKSLIFISEGSSDSSSSGSSRNSDTYTIRGISDQVQPPVQSLASQQPTFSNTINLMEYDQHVFKVWNTRF